MWFELLTVAAMTNSNAVEPSMPFVQPISDRGAAFIQGKAVDPTPIRCIDNFAGGRDERIERTLWLDKFHLGFEMADETVLINEIEGPKGCRGDKNVSIRFLPEGVSIRDGLCAGRRFEVYAFGANGRFLMSFCKLGSFYRAKSSGE